VHLIHLAQKLQVLGERRRWAADAYTGLFRDVFPALFSHHARQAFLDIERPHGDFVDPREFK
jgi:hypothetical protein